MRAHELLPSAEAIRQDYHVYPGQALVSAACIVATFPKVEDAADRTKYGFCEAEGNSHIPGAGGVATAAVGALIGYRKHGDLERVIRELHDAWDRLTGPGSGNFEDNHREGQLLAKDLEPRLRKALPLWYKSRHRHLWTVTAGRASWRTKGASGRGRTIDMRRECPCGKVQWRWYDESSRRWKWRDEEAR